MRVLLVEDSGTYWWCVVTNNASGYRMDPGKNYRFEWSGNMAFYLN